MREDAVDRYCATLPGAAPSAPFGDDIRVWCVAGHMFAAFAIGGEGVSVHSGDAERLIETGQAHTVPYLRRWGWVLLPWRTKDDQLRARISASYHAVRRSLPPRERAKLRRFGPPMREDATRH